MTELCYKKELLILTSRCDASGRLGIADSVDLFMDAATEHQDALGSGVYALAKNNKFWVTARTRVDFIERPKLMDRITLSTWITRPESIYGDRHYCIQKDDKVLTVGRTRWTIMDMSKGKLIRMTGIYPEDMAFPEKEAISDPYARLDAATDWQPFAKYEVRSTDIDIGHHMNNVAYIRALQSLFTVKEWEEMDIRSIEIHYKSPCYEGDILNFSKCISGEKTCFAARSNGRITVEYVLR